MASKRFRSGDVDDSTTFSISDLASEFDISSRTIRFYEEKGLLCPQRTKGNQPKPRLRFHQPTSLHAYQRSLLLSEHHANVQRVHRNP